MPNKCPKGGEETGNDIGAVLKHSEGGRGWSTGHIFIISVVTNVIIVNITVVNIIVVNIVFVNITVVNINLIVYQ